MCSENIKSHMFRFIFIKKLSSLRSNKNIQKKEGGPDRFPSIFFSKMLNRSLFLSRFPRVYLRLLSAS